MKRENRPRLSWGAKFAVAFRGIYLAVRHERSCWVHLAVTIGIVSAGAFFQISLAEWSSLVLCATLVWTAELLNTAIERLSEIVQPHEDKRIAAMLDIAAGAVLIAAIGAATVGTIIFLPRFWILLQGSAIVPIT
jgi:diacylglycerol kinase